MALRPRLSTGLLVSDEVTISYSIVVIITKNLFFDKCNASTVLLDVIFCEQIVPT